MVHQKAPCCKAGRFSYVDLYWENRHLVSGLPFLVYTSEYSISGLRVCLQNGGSAVSWKSELNPPSWTVFCRLPRRKSGCNKTLEREKRQIKPAREKRVVRWLSRGIAHIERVKKHARVFVMCYTLSIGIYFALAPFPVISAPRMMKQNTSCYKNFWKS